MAFGTFGSTLSDELNRLANGGTYRDMDDMVDEALAAKQWANRENIVPYSTDTVGILNEIAALGPNRQNWFDFNGVCNYLAGTTGLPAAAALRQITTTGDILTSLAAFYVDANNFNAPGYVYLSGTSGNFMSVPDSSLLDITGDIDIRARLALTNWASGSEQRVVSKWASGQGSYVFSVLGNGTLLLSWYPDGVTAGSATSTSSVTFNPNQIGWVRVTLDVSDGSGNNVTTFYTSTDGVNWTTLGTPITQAFITSIFSGTANLGMGSSSAGTAALATGKFYQLQILNGINGTNALNANMTGVSQSATSFTDSTNQTITINGVRLTAQDVDNLGSAGSLLPVTVGSSLAADSNDAKFLAHDGTNYVYVPSGSSSNFLSIPDAAALDITGDIDIRMRIALDDYSATAQELITKSTTNQRSFAFYNWSGAFRLYISSDGTNWTASSPLTSSAHGITNGAPKWVRVTLDVDNGASGNDTKFWLSDDGITWTQLGSTITTAGTTSIFASTTQVLVAAGAATNAKIYRAQILNGIDGTTVLDVDTSAITTGSATSFTAVTGQTVTINRSTSGRKTVAVTQPTWLFGTDDFMEVNNRWLERTTANYLYLPGVAGNWATSPDSAALDITGDIDIRVKVALDDWTPGSIMGLVGKSDPAADAYYFNVQANGTLLFGWLDSVPTAFGAGSIVAGIADGATKWVRATLDVDNGAGGHDVKFFTSDDGTTWTQLGSTYTGAGTTNIRSTSAQLSIGNRRTSLEVSRGKFFRAQVLNGIGGTVAFDADFESSITSLLQTTFTESSLNAATVTINRSGSTYRSAGVIDAGYLYPGATNTFSNSTIDYLNFGATDSYTILVAARDFGSNAAQRPFISKKQAEGTTGVGYFLWRYGTLTYTEIYDGAVRTGVYNSGSYVPGSLDLVSATRDVLQDKLSVQIDGVTATGTATATDATTLSLANINTLRIGNIPGGISGDMELYGAAVFRTVLTPAQIRQIFNYFANREAYL